MRSNSTSRIADPRELSEAGPESRIEYVGSPSDIPRPNMSEQRAQRPVVVGVPMESVKTGPHWVPPSQQHSAGVQPLLGSAQPLMTAGRPVPLSSGSGRIPEGGGNASMKQRSVFEGPRGAGSPLSEVRLTGTGPRVQQLQVSQAAHSAPPLFSPPPQYAPQENVRRVIGQATVMAAEPREAEIERIIERQLPPQGMTKKEASQLADALSTAVVVSEQALAAGERCFGVDDAAIADAKATRDYLLQFVNTASAADRTNPGRLPKERLDIVERVIECQMAHERLQGQGGPSLLALLLGGAIVAGVTYFLVKEL